MKDDIEHTSLEHFDTIMNTNVRGPFFMTMLAAPHIIRTRGNYRVYSRHFSKLAEVTAHCQIANDWVCFVVNKL